MTVSALNDFRALNRANVGAIFIENDMRPTLNVFLRGEGAKAHDYDTPEQAMADGERLMQDYPGLVVARAEPLLALNPAMVDSSIEVGKDCWITFKGTQSVIKLTQNDWPEAKALADKINALVKPAKRPMAIQTQGNVVQLLRK